MPEWMHEQQQIETAPRWFSLGETPEQKATKLNFNNSPQSPEGQEKKMQGQLAKMSPTELFDKKNTVFDYVHDNWMRIDTPTVIAFKQKLVAYLVQNWQWWTIPNDPSRFTLANDTGINGVKFFSINWDKEQQVYCGKTAPVLIASSDNSNGFGSMWPWSRYAIINKKYLTRLSFVR